MKPSFAQPKNISEDQTSNPIFFFFEPGYCTPPIIDIGIIQHRAARYNIYTGETILPPSPLVLVVIEADTTNLSKCPHNLAPIKIHKYKYTDTFNL